MFKVIFFIHYFFLYIFLFTSFYHPVKYTINFFLKNREINSGMAKKFLKLLCAKYIKHITNGIVMENKD